MRSLSKLSSVVSTTAMTALLGALALPGNAMAIELSDRLPGYGDSVPAIHNDNGKTVIVRTDISLDELKKMRDTLGDQTRQLEELKRSSGSSASAGSRETDQLKEQVKKQDGELDTLRRQMEELKRSSGSSSSAGSRDTDELRNKVKEQDRELDNLRRQVEELKRSSGSSSSSSELSSLKRDVSDQDRAIDQLKRTVEELSRKVK
ncbi:hypothetical protein [Pseudomonas sp. R16(2017)]|uniref:hypothetical protein n=1 Tax=Pseudomonas sp. R16(2017) TaxID=1981704 RepID=UPI000A1EF733|nr:hypothetical protein [Pseudomonas sp. R16(2017)]